MGRDWADESPTLWNQLARNIGLAERAPASVTPRHRVHLRSFAAGKYLVTFAEWDACLADDGCEVYRPDDEHFGRGRQPVMNVSWHDAQAYVSWLSQKTGKHYRLLSEAEWEYSARAGKDSEFWWGDRPSHDYANYGDDQDCMQGPYKQGRDQWDYTSPVGSFPPNPFGLYDMLGNLYEWTADCAASQLSEPPSGLDPQYKGYEGAPNDGSARVWPGCRDRITRSSSYGNCFLSTTARGSDPADMRFGLIGFRVARDL